MKFASTITLSTATAALLACNTNAFTTIAHSRKGTGLASSSVSESGTLSFVDEDTTSDAPSNLLVNGPAEVIEKPKPKKKAPKQAVHKDVGVFVPLVKVTRKIMGADKFTKFRAKVIGMHSGVIRDFVDTADSKFGQLALQTLFTFADLDNSGSIDEGEFKIAMRDLGFNNLTEQQLANIFDRADKDKNGTLDIEEFMADTPKTLKTSLIKLAKSNGEDLGFLS